MGLRHPVTTMYPNPLHRIEIRIEILSNPKLFRAKPATPYNIKPSDGITRFLL